MARVLQILPRVSAELKQRLKKCAEVRRSLNVAWKEYRLLRARLVKQRDLLIHLEGLLHEETETFEES